MDDLYATDPVFGARGSVTYLPLGLVLREELYPTTDPVLGSGGGEDANAIDVIVLGAGLAGLVAARELLAAGRRVLLLEARQRVGGRCLTVHGPTHALEDLGAEWVQPAVHPLMLRELQRHGIALEAGSEEGSGEEGAAAQGLAPTSPALAPLLARIDADSALVPQGALFAPSAAHLDISWGDYLARAAGAQGQALAAHLEAKTFPFSGTPAASVSALAMLREVRQFGGALALLTEGEARMQGGAQALPAALHARLPAGVVRLGCQARRVTAVPEGGALVEFSCEGSGQLQRAHAALGVLVALPFNVLPSLQLTPPLPASVLQQARARHAGACTKTFFTPQPAAADAAAEAPLPACSFSYASRCATRSVLFCAEGPPPPSPARTHLTSHSWCTDEHSCGTWMAPRPGGQLQALEELRTLEGSIRFIGGDMSLQWPGWMEGAVYAGLHNPFLPAAAGGTASH